MIFSSVNNGVTVLQKLDPLTLINNENDGKEVWKLSISTQESLNLSREKVKYYEYEK